MALSFRFKNYSNGSEAVQVGSIGTPYRYDRNDMVTQQESDAVDSSTRFWNRFAERYAKQTISDQDAYQKKLQLTQKYLDQDSSVLEFGCGTGSTALDHAPRVKTIVGIDYAQKMVDIANRRLDDSTLTNVEFRCTTLFDTAYDNKNFDAVLGLNVLHLVDDYRASIQRAYRLLKPGGVFISSTACLSNKWKPLMLLLFLGGALGLIPKLQFITLDDLEFNITECGFTLIEKLAPKTKNGAVFMIARK